jgi:hypothetical protein
VLTSFLDTAVAVIRAMQASPELAAAVIALAFLALEEP